MPDEYLIEESGDEYRHVFTPLDVGKRQFRVLFMQPGDFEIDEEIYVSLNITSLNAPTPFKAISHTCESLARRETILVNDTQFPVTESQYRALRRLRHPEEVTIWWLDDVCINQADPIERAEQVSIIHEIYTKSRENQIWLGEPDSLWMGYLDGEELQDLLHKFMVNPHIISRKDLDRFEGSREYYREMIKNNGTNVQSATEGAIAVAKILASGPDLLELPFYYSRDTGSLSPHWQWYFHFATFAYIVTRPWWSSLWMAHEILFGKSPPMLHLGSLVVPLKMFINALSWLQTTYESSAPDQLKLLEWCTYTRPDIPFDITSIGGSFHSWIRSYRKQYYSLETLLRVSSSVKVKDPRDRIFALSGFQEPSQRLPVSYTLPPSWLFSYVMWRLCISRNELDWLAQFRLANPGRTEREASLPSWVPDFADPSANHTLTFEMDIPRDKPDWTITTMVDDYKVRVMANPLDSITACFDPFWTTEDASTQTDDEPPSTTHSSTAEDPITAISLASVFRELQMSGFSQSDYVQTLLGNTSILPDHLRKSNSQWDILDLCTRALRSELGSRYMPDEQFNYRELGIIRTIKRQLRGARMFITSEWRLGIGPASAEVGDVLYHVHGCAAPLILRAASGRITDENYEVLGAAYVEDLVGAAAADHAHSRVITLV